MQIKTADGIQDVASQGKGNAALTTGIIGTSLGGLLALGAGNGNGLFSGLFGGGCADARSAVASLQAELAKEKAERYADSVGIGVYKDAIALSNKNDDKIQANYVELAKAIAALDKQVAVDRQATTDNFAFLNSRIDEKYREIKCYVDGTFVPGKLVMPLSSICPEAMQRYNSWTAPTEPAPAA